MAKSAAQGEPNVAVDGEAAPSWDPRPFIAWLRDNQMRRRQWNQADLARALDLPPGTISSWLKGDKRPSSRSSQHLADVLGADPDYVLHLTGHRPLLEPDHDAQRERFVSLVRRVALTPERVEILEDILVRWLARDQEQRRARTPRTKAGRERSSP